MHILRFISYVIAAIFLIPAIVLILAGGILLGISERIDDQASIDLDRLIGQ